MNKPPRVRGLLDFGDTAPDSQGSDQEIEFEFVEVEKNELETLERWAQFGKLAFEHKLLSDALRKPVGRPPKSILRSDDVLRALYAWDFVRRTRIRKSNPDLNMTNREAIQLLTLLETELKMPIEDRLFGASSDTLETSLSRGRTMLKIDKFWQSEVCAKLLYFIPNDKP